MFLATSYGLSAQISIGPKAGINLANVGGDGTDGFDTKSIVGLQFGAAAEISVNEMIAVQPELLYFQKGTSIDFGSFGGEVDQVLNYLEIPVLLKLKFGQEGGPKFFGTVGPSFGFGLNGKLKSDAGDEDIDFDDDEIKKLDISASIGAGAEFAAGPGNLFIDVRYLLGLSTTDDSEFDADIKNRGIGIGVGYLIPIGQ